MTFKIRLPGNELHTRNLPKGNAYTLTLAFKGKNGKDILTMVVGTLEENFKIGQAIFRILESSVELYPNDYNSENYVELFEEVNTRLKQDIDYKGLLLSAHAINIQKIKIDEYDTGRKALERLCFLMALEDKTEETDIDPLDPKLLEKIEILKKKGEEAKRLKTL